MAWNQERDAKSTIAAASNATRLRKSMTDAEKRLWNALRYELDLPTGVHFRRQFAIGNYIVDFACLQYRLIIEVDGPIHNELNQVQCDDVREEFLKQEGFAILRFTNKEVLMRRPAVLNSVIAALAITTPIRRLTPTPSPQGGRLEITT
jgi:very-short-patch-repair endonuclease